MDYRLSEWIMGIQIDYRLSKRIMGIQMDGYPNGLWAFIWIIHLDRFIQI
jgi:hypothetical protein